LAFALGSQTSVSNILAAYYLQKIYKIGQTVKIGDIEGQITQMTPTALILQTPAGQMMVPAKVFSETVSTLTITES
jgi:small-conductance mechanosensitive channel